jgi:hypothetical protein
MRDRNSCVTRKGTIKCIEREREREKWENILCGEENERQKSEHFLIYLKQNLLFRLQKAVK